MAMQNDFNVLSMCGSDYVQKTSEHRVDLESQRDREDGATKDTCAEKSRAKAMVKCTSCAASGSHLVLRSTLSKQFQAMLERRACFFL